MYSHANLEQLFQVIGEMPEQIFCRTKDYDFIQTKNSIWPNQIVNFQANESSLESIINNLEQEVSNGLVPDLLMLNPQNEDNFISIGLKKRNNKYSVWSAMTHKLNFQELLINNSELKVKRVENRNDLERWILIVEQELMGGGSLNSDIIHRLFEDKIHCFFFLGWLNEKPVSTSFLFIQGSIAGMYLVATDKKHRRKGFGTEMTNICLKTAKELNCFQVDIQATDLGLGVYSKLGFVKCGDIYVFRIVKNQQ